MTSTDSLIPGSLPGAVRALAPRDVARSTRRSAVLLLSALLTVSLPAGCGPSDVGDSGVVGVDVTAVAPADSDPPSSSATTESSDAEGGEGNGGDVESEGTTALRFDDASAASGISFRHDAGYSEGRYTPEIMGGGVAMADFNRDGAPDLLFANSGAMWEAERPDGAEDQLYLGNGDGTFRNASAEWGLPDGRYYGQGVVAGDYDGDGWTDVFLGTHGPGERLLRNTGSGFEDVTEAAGVGPHPGWSTSAAFIDLENDGDLDLWVLHYVDYFDKGDVNPCYAQDVQIYCTPRLHDAQADRLLRNEGDGTFTDISAEAGLDGRTGKGMALVVGDLDLDGDSDVYIANDLSANQLWINEGGAFSEIGMRSGVAVNAQGREEAGMGADMSDFDGDGLLDLANTNFQTETTSMLRQREGMFFDEVSDPLGVGMTARARLSWGLDFFDGDNDGDEDLIVANGHIYDNVESFTTGVTFAQPNTLYENRGERFSDVTEQAGSALADLQVTRGIVTGDVDGDGLLDIVANNNGGTPLVGLNRSADAGHFVSFWLEGRGGADGANRNAIGAWARATVDGREIVRQVFGSQSYLSLSDFRMHFGLGDATSIERLEIHWPGEAEPQVIESLAADRFYRVVQGQAPVEYTPGAATIAP